MPQPESWSSDWRISGFSASSNSCRIETGSAATQPNTRHIPEACYPPRGSRCRGRTPAAPSFVTYEHRGDRTKADLVGAAGQALRPRTARRRGEEPPARAPGGGDRLPEGEGRAPVHLHNELAPQP